MILTYNIKHNKDFSAQLIQGQKAGNRGCICRTGIHTSQTCSRCGSLDNRNGKKFQCVCGHADHADVNASFNIGKPVSCCSPVLRTQNTSQLCKESDLCKGSTDTPQAAMSKMMIAAEPTTL